MEIGVRVKIKLKIVFESKKDGKTHFRLKMGAKFKINLKIVLRTINFIYPENPGILGQFLREIE